MERTVELGTLITPAKIKRCGEEDYPILSMTMHNGLVFQEEKFKKVIASKDTSDYKVVYRNQLVISFPIDEGVLATQRITDAGIVSPAYGIWDVDQTQVLPEFLEYALRSNRAIQYYKAKLRGSTARRRSLPTPTLLAFSVPLPDLEKQSDILKKIHKAKGIAILREQELQLLDELIKARFVEMFGTPDGNNIRYPQIAVKDLTNVVSGGTPNRKNKAYWDRGTIPWVKTTELQNCRIAKAEEYITEAGLNESSARLVPKDTVLIAMYGQGKTRGMTAILDVPASTNQACACLLPSSSIKAEFLWQYMIMSYDRLRNLAQGGNQPNLNSNMIKSFTVLVPPKNLQEEYVDFVKKINKSKFGEITRIHFCFKQ